MRSRIAAKARPASAKTPSRPRTNGNTVFAIEFAVASPTSAVVKLSTKSLVASNQVGARAARTTKLTTAPMTTPTMVKALLMLMAPPSGWRVMSVWIVGFSRAASWRASMMARCECMAQWKTVDSLIQMQCFCDIQRRTYG